MLQLFYSITITSMFLCLILALFFILTRSGNRGNNLILAGLVIVFGIQIFYSFAVSNFAYSYFMDMHKSLFLLRQTSLLMGPMIFIYLNSSLRSIQLRFGHLIHGLPFILSLIAILLYYRNVQQFVIWKSRIDLYDTILILTISLIYIIASVSLLNSYKKEFTLNYVLLRKVSHVKWLQFIIIAFIIVWLLNLNIFAIYMITRNPKACAYTGSIFSMSLFILICMVLLFLLLKPVMIFYVRKNTLRFLKPEDDLKIKHDLLYYMQNHKPYLEPEISLEHVARNLNVSPRVLSMTINSHFGNNFNAYVNEYRIREAINQLSAPDNKKTIQEIFYESGFNSKSAFYAEFKKYTGFSPQEFRRQRTQTA